MVRYGTNLLLPIVALEAGTVNKLLYNNHHE